MFGLFKRKPPPDPELIAHIKHWVAALLNLSDADTIMVAELACRDPGCVDLETVVTVICVDRRQFVLRFPGPLADVTEAAVQSLGPRSP
jgi:hypothetical protein